ncbi:MAG: hypothetical protein GX329_02430 [Tissierellia bacterium]|nr:hypothetical protein [Tissierellia bacterium]
MSIHIGENISIFKEDIIAIIDRKTVETSKDMRRFVDIMIGNGNVCNNNIEDAKTYILAYENRRKSDGTTDGKCNLYLSNISSITLSRRGNNKKTNWGLAINE